MIHGLSRKHIPIPFILHWLSPRFPSDQSRRIPDSCCSRWHINQNQRSCPDLGTLTNLDVAQDGGPSADQDPIADLGVAVAYGLASATECDMVEDGDVIANDCCFTNHDTGCMVKEDALPDVCCWVDVDGKHICDARLEGQCKRFAVLGPDVKINVFSVRDNNELRMTSNAFSCLNKIEYAVA